MLNAPCSNFWSNLADFICPIYRMHANSMYCCWKLVVIELLMDIWISITCKLCSYIYWCDIQWIVWKTYTEECIFIFSIPFNAWM